MINPKIMRADFSPPTQAAILLDMACF